MPERVWVHVFLEARSLGGFLASVPDHLGVDRCIAGMPAVAWKQPGTRSSAQAAAMCTEFRMEPLYLPNVEWDFAKKHEDAWKVLRNND
jgi:hypothetical protein